MSFIVNINYATGSEEIIAVSDPFDADATELCHEFRLLARDGEPLVGGTATRQSLEPLNQFGPRFEATQIEYYERGRWTPIGL